jgi:IS30 family transposase
MAYQQLTQNQRYQIDAFLKAGFSQSRIARQLDIDPSPISRDLKGNRGQRGDRPKQAQHLADLRRKAKENAPRITTDTWRQVEALLHNDWSPEPISGTLKQPGQPAASHERIYQPIYADQPQGGDLHTPRRGQKKRRKRYGKYDRRGQIPKRKSMDERPAIVATKERLGDWEIGRIIGKTHQQAMVSAVERKSKLTRLAKIERKTEAAVQAALIRRLAPLSDCAHTITADNGKEFAAHEALAEALGAEFYFAHPYHS